MKLHHMGWICLVWSFTFSLMGQEGSLLKNGDFSAVNEKGRPAGWTIPSSEDHVDLIAREGQPAEKVLKVTLGPTQKYQGQILQRFPVQKNHIYRLSGDMKSSADRTGFFQFKLYKNKKEQRRQNLGRSATEWKTYSGDFYVGDADMAEVLLRYYLFPKTEGTTVEFAKISLVDLGEKVYVPPSVETVEVVSTFSSAGVELQLAGDVGEEVGAKFRYREVGQEAWQQGLDPVYIAHLKQFRGSLLNLKESTAYEVGVLISDPEYKDGVALDEKIVTFKTWTSDVPVVKTVHLPAGISNEALTISEKGTAEGWIRYVGHPDGTILDVGKTANQVVKFDDAAYVIFEQVTLRGGASQGIVVSKSNHIRIRHCDIAHWGDPGQIADPVIPNKGLYVDENGKGINWQAGVMIAPGASQVVVEHNFIHAANGTANSWQYGHPLGPQGVIMNNSEGNHVIRYNDIVGSEDHWWNDGIEGMWNNKVKGGPYRDTDIYGNLIAFSNDDGTELDGGQQNVRYFNNWVQWAYCGISCAPNLNGPSYVYRNLFVLGEERNQVNFAFKMGGAKFKNQGMSLLFHNTVYSLNAGLSTGHYGSGSSPVWSRNNAVYAKVAYLKGGAEDYDLDYDLIAPNSFIPGPLGNYENGVWALPEFEDMASGDYRLKAGSPGVDQGILIPGMNDVFAGAAPDMGAYERDGTFHPVPVRPDGLYVVPAFLGFESGASEAGTLTVSLKAPARLGRSWTLVEQSEWLKITPASGSTGGKDQRLDVSIENVPSELGLHRGSFTLRTSDGYFRTVPVQVLVRPEHPVRLVLEAEDAEVVGNRYQEFADESASGGAYMMIPYQADPVLRFNDPEDVDSELVFTFSVPEDGRYYISGNLMIPGPDSPQRDSMYMAMNDGEITRWNLSQAGREAWSIQKIQGGSGSDGMAFELKAGVNVLRLLPREVGNQIDQIIISNEP
ncbi:carbohydrate binding domain-containing protein [Kiritimatiellota bacterium B12222]|nr:carbohydrate binding domain-containing protein [Kiritimatiellota bacterium B12222]